MNMCHINSPKKLLFIKILGICPGSEHRTTYIYGICACSKRCLKAFVGAGRSQQFYIVLVQSLSSILCESLRSQQKKYRLSPRHFSLICQTDDLLIKEKRNHLSNPSCYYFSISSSSFSSSFTLPSRRFFPSRASCSFFCASSICMRREISSCFRSYIS